MALKQTTKSAVVFCSFGGLLKNNLVNSIAHWIFFATAYRQRTAQ